ncbi:hypothetical protein C0J52_09800 [Blattella germanica]|nr:hypothetical protein C0J52_09800 [Blattella germanica]PSN42480.1 hypothetical protein C0J52_09800 [Blattella germanica]PSN42481.1 hypothetical protein C0J52_09800 [Blattella germanica]PSN42482.1 hypothetical protein C0J52_09800 [Blattella germanica]
MKFALRPVPCVSTIRSLTKRFRETVSVNNQESNGQCRVLTKEKLNDIAERLEHTPRKSLKRLAHETGVSEFSARNATKLLKLKPYKIPVFQHGKSKLHITHYRTSD